MHASIETKELIFAPGRQPFASCHASNLCLLPDGTVLAVWFGGSEEGADDVGIWLARRTGTEWSDPRCVAAEDNLPHWNPVLHLQKDGSLLLYYKIGRVISRWRTFYRVSGDLGASWSEPKELVPGDEGGRGPVRCKSVPLSDGTLIAGLSTEEGTWQCFAERSRDDGITWEQSAPIRISKDFYRAKGVSCDNAEALDSRGVIQPTLWESAPGALHMLMRSTEGRVFRADSCDNGLTWTDAYATSLPNNNSGIDLCRMGDGTLILCANPIADNWGARTPITLQYSQDDGQTWQPLAVLEDRPGEYSYPCILALGDNLHVSFTYDRDSIAYFLMKLHND